MTYRLLLDEHIEHEVFHRLGNYDHDVEHVEFASSLGKEATDGEIARYSLEVDRLILTYDDDFVTKFDEDAYRGVFFFEDEQMSYQQVADITHAVSHVYPQDQVSGLEKVGREWL